ncbi:phosphohistidine phosphatase SixA [Burkholderia cenocepacia]|nr:phosphohistidine phosphatase SixA [Burkholderia cenocepacia]RQV35162.1 phosphohistidine phosphatase SixA [Burkholderia cenocepacia]RQV36786.1 phosphohistidine phosphatase SixA [Burkholderia cenocepacia]RQV81683.1 phosphohistidine phosphatase SixA [Burkholderia cenocepacia]
MRYQAALRSDEPKIITSNDRIGQSRYEGKCRGGERSAICDNSRDDRPPSRMRAGARRSKENIMMNLILWRHAEAEDYATSDLARQLTVRGRKDAQAMAKWLRGRLETNTVILASPAARTVQTVEALTDQYRTVDALAPGGSVDDVLAAAGWPDGIAPTVVIVGHQPTLGSVAAQLVAGDDDSWSVKKGGIVWLASRTRDGSRQAVLRAVLTPELV